MKALKSFTVRPHLPAPLAALDRLSSNLRWSWDRPTRELFIMIDSLAWDEGGHDPRRVLAEASTERLLELSTDPVFLERLAAADAALSAYLDLPRWYQQVAVQNSGLAPTAPTEFGANANGAIAYFSPEFGISEAVPQYSGGLGILAGDHLKAASDLGVPLVAIGLFYRHGYFRQSLSVDGWQQERFPDLDPHAMALELCDGVRITLDLAGETLTAQVWKATVGRTPLYLLDADIPENPESLQLVTDRLYGGDVEHRLRQEILLGVGGIRALRALGIDAEVFHTNEGHAGFLGLERIREHMSSDGLSFDQALAAVRAGAVFTTHTPVPAGIDRFPRELMEKYFGSWAAACGISIDQLMKLGHRPEEATEEPFNMAVMGMRLAERRNGVSALHGEVSREMFAELWPGVPEDETPVGSITNGVHGATWVSAEIAEVLSDSVGENWQWAEADAWQPILTVDDQVLQDARDASKVRMVDHVRDRLRSHGLAQGRSSSELEWVNAALSPTALTICFARRMATYKRAALLLSQPERLMRLLLNEERPIQFIFAGKAHPADELGKELIRQIVAFSADPQIRDRFMFVEDYDMALARSLVQGADVWLNTPVRPMEASGTSGMKAVLNGALHCSVLDGWWAECFSSGNDEDSAPGQSFGPNGWAISSAESIPDEARRIELEANSLFELLETQIIPLYYDQADSQKSFSEAWLTRVKENFRTLGPFVGAHRMVKDYVEGLYIPAAARAVQLSSDDFAGARTLAAFHSRLESEWHQVHVDRIEINEDVAELGAQRQVTASVALGGLDPSEVDVQLLVGHVGQSGELENTQTVLLQVHGAEDEQHLRYTGTAVLSTAGRMGVTARVVPRHDLLEVPIEFGLVAWAG
jgi:starch phosphorylase